MTSQRHGSRTQMYFRMLRRAAQLRKGQAAAALIALAVAATAATAMLTLYVDAQAKLRKEFRKFGANIIVESTNGSDFSPETTARIRAVVDDRGSAVPFGYVVARSQADQAVVVAGVNFAEVQKLNPWWSVTSWPHGNSEALIGVRAAKVLSPAGQPFTLQYAGREITLLAAGTVRTGAGEDSRVYISLGDFAKWTGRQPSVIEIAAYGSTAEIASLLRKLQTEIPDAEVRPVRQITEGEANILRKTRSTLLYSVFFITVTAALCVLATLSGWVIDRRRDFAIMKAIGAPDRLIALFIAGEAALLAAAGTVVGFGAGAGLAALIGRINFNAPITPRLSVFPPVLLGALLVTLTATLVPLQLLRSVHPAMILRGE